MLREEESSDGESEEEIVLTVHRVDEAEGSDEDVARSDDSGEKDFVEQFQIGHVNEITTSALIEDTSVMNTEKLIFTPLGNKRHISPTHSPRFQMILQSWLSMPVLNARKYISRVPVSIQEHLHLYAG